MEHCFRAAGRSSKTSSASCIFSESAASNPALNTERRHAIPNTVSTLLNRNLQDVFGENDPTRRRAAIDEIFTEDRATHPDFQYQPIAEPEELGDGGRVQWVSGRPGEAPTYAGTDFIVARDGRIAALYLFFDKQPLLLDSAMRRPMHLNAARSRG
jgi:hypothetical protein